MRAHRPDPSTRGSRAVTRPAALLALAAAFAVPAAAQRVAPQACEQGRISNIFVDNHSVFDLSDPDLNPRFDWAYTLANSVHRATREDVVRRELLFAVDGCYDVMLMQDSERLLRGLDFIADVDIYGVRQPDGTVHVIVDTQDEWSTRVEPRFSGGSFSGLRLREDNLFGTGQHVSAFYRQDQEDETYGVSYAHPQFLRTRWDALLDAGKTPVGHLFREALTSPFVGEVGRWGLRQAVQHHDRYFEYLMRDGDDLLAIWVPERRQSFDIGAAFRWAGRGYNRTLFGAALTGEWVTYPGVPRFGDPERRLLSRFPPPDVPMDAVSSVRAMVLTGQRNVYFVRRRALDTVRGTEDVRLGVETEVAFGPSIPGLSTDRDLVLELGFFAGGEPIGGLLSGTNFVLEARRSYETAPDESEWGDVFAQLNAWTYWHPEPDSRHTVVAAVSAVGGWHDRVPFQLTLGGDAGLRGYPRHVDPGARRVVASVEQRTYLGWPLPDLFDLGAAAFVDAGRIWGGDAPFGVDSPVRVDVGVGLRAAFPPGSRQTLRLDVGVPVRGGVGFNDVVLSVGVGQLIGSRAARRDPQLTRSSRQGVSTSIFVFPE